MRWMGAIRRLLANQYDMLAMQALQPLTGAYLPFSGASMRPAALMAVINEVVLNRRQTIFECGSGISTVFLARVLREQGGTLVSVEHDRAWLDVVQAWLKRESLASSVTLVHAPLVPVDMGGDSHDWYDMAAVRSVLSASRMASVDLLVVDGPPAGGGVRSEARYPAVPLLREYLCESATVILDDADRRGERRVVARWQAESPFRFEFRGSSGGIAIGRSGKSYLV